MRIVVIGGGIVGASAAYHLAVTGTDVVLLDRGDHGQATAAGAGVVFPWQLPGSPAGWQPLADATIAHWPQLVSALSAPGMPDPGVEPVGVISLGQEGAELHQMYDALSTLPGEPGFEGLGDIELLATGEPAQQFPVLRPDLAGVSAFGVRRVDGRLLRDALVSAARAQGASIRMGNARLRTDEERVTGVTFGDEDLEADAVVAAAGAWTPALVAPAGIDLSVVPVRGQVLHIDLPGEPTETWPVIRAGEAHFLLGFPGGRVVSGATHESDAGFEYRATVSGAHRLLTEALAVAPGLAGGSVAEVRVGFRPVSLDGLPILGRADGLDGLVIATGLGANGLTFGPCAGALAADLALGGTPTTDLTAYRPDRPAIAAMASPG